MTRNSRVVMFAWGNPSRGDDAVGPWFADRFRNRAGNGFVLVEDFQLQVEHLLDCQGGQLLLFVDACSSEIGSYRFTRLGENSDLAHTSHALSPEELLGQYRRVLGQAPPPAFQLAIPGVDFELGNAMSTAPRECCGRAAELVEELLACPDCSSWMERVN